MAEASSVLAQLRPVTFRYKAHDGGPLQFRNVVIDSGSGTIEAVNGSQVQLLNGTVINNANFAALG